MKIIINNNNSTSIKKKTESSSSSGLIIGIIIGGGVAFVALITTIIICVKKECCGICDKISLKKNEPTEQTYDMSTTENITFNNKTNCIFQTNEGKQIILQIGNDQTISMLLFSYLNYNHQTKLFDKSKITFVYKNNIIDFNCPSKIGDYFETSNPIINVYYEEQVIGGNEKIEVIFKTQKGLEKKIPIEKTKSVGELIQLFLNGIGRMDLYNSSDLIFFLNANKITNYNETVESLIASSPSQYYIITALGGLI